MSILQLAKKNLSLGVLGLSDLITSKQTLPRTPEPEVSDGIDQVEQYNNVMDSTLTIIYAICLEVFDTLTPDKKQIEKMVDICCGPGQFTKLLRQQYPDTELNVVDLSEQMLEKLKQNVPTAVPHHDDMTKLNAFEDHSLDLVITMNSIHHLPDEEKAREAFIAFERVAKEDGLIFVQDVNRLKSKFQTQLYTETTGMKTTPGFEFFQKDFELSMDAAWTHEDLLSFIPEDTQRSWYVMRPLTIRAMSIIVGVPKSFEEKHANLLNSPWSNGQEFSKFVPTDFHGDLAALRKLFKINKSQKINTAA